jgi:hypothetical protein
MCPIGWGCKGFHPKVFKENDMPLKQWAAYVSVFALVVALAPYGHAIPAFSRQYGTSCATCHVDFPKLNDFGKAFKDAGFKFPKDDETFLKVPPVMLGAPAQREMWPHTIFPGTIPGLPAIGLRFNTFFQVYGRNRNNFAPPAPGSPGIPRTDFQPGLFSIFTAGNFGSGIAFWVDEDFSVGGDNSQGGLGDGYLKFHDIGRIFKLPKDSLNLRVGQFEIDLPFSPARSWNISGWDIYDEANFGARSLLGPGDVNNAFAFSSPGQGVEFSGGHNYGGYHYSFAVLNQNTSGTTASGDNVSPVVGIFSDSNFKDLYGRFQYRFNLEKDRASRNEIQAAGASGPRDHTYLQLGTYYFYGRSVQRIQQGESPVFTVREPFYRTGGDFSFNYRTFNLFGLFMYGHDRSQVLNEDGTLSPTTARFNGGFLEADYLALPWLMTIMRYDRVQSEADFLLGQAGASTNFFQPASATRNRITPGVQFLIHANIKASFEYQVRPKQTGTDTNGSPFTQRTNQAVAGLEWVY